jgi:hypothetical protein
MYEDMETEVEMEIERRVSERLEAERQLRQQRARSSDEESNDLSDGVGTVTDRVNPGNCRWRPENYDSPGSDEPYVT